MKTEIQITLLSFLTLAGACAGNSASSASECKTVIGHAKEIIAQYDSNRDGKLDANEWKPAAEQIDRMTRQTNEKYDSQGGESGQDLFRQGDLNGDNRLELTEIARVPIGSPPVMKSCMS
jgi:hypothetical protein